MAINSLSVCVVLPSEIALGPAKLQPLQEAEAQLLPGERGETHRERERELEMEGLIWEGGQHRED